LTISKLLEKCVKIRLTEFSDYYKFFNPNQFRFRKKLFSMDACYHATKVISDNLDAKKENVGVSLDLKKAFHSVDHY
jgi:hypothetical protein